MTTLTPIKDALSNVYLKWWPILKKELQGHPTYSLYHHPHLLSTTKEFEDKWRTARTRVMIFGIATNGWGHEDDIYSLGHEEAVSQLMCLYDSFYFSGGNWRYGQAFWNYYYSIIELLNYKLGGGVEVIWNNVHKTHPELRDLESRSFNPMQIEIEVLDPDVILLMGKDEKAAFFSKIPNIQTRHVRDVMYNDGANQRVLYHEYEVMPDSKVMRLRKVFITYHPNARGNAGIRLKLMLDQITESIRA